MGIKCFLCMLVLALAGRTALADGAIDRGQTTISNHRIIGSVSFRHSMGGLFLPHS